jgi:DNA-binding MarR family transcriptional regulator
MQERERHSDLFQNLTLNIVLHQQELATKLGLNLTDFKCLGILHRHSGMTPKRLAEMTGLSGAAVTTVIDRLEQSGFAKRKRDSDDRRSLTLEATAGGGSKVKSLYRSLGKRLSKLNEGFTADELQTVYRYLAESTVVLSKEIESLREED